MRPDRRCLAGLALAAVLPALAVLAPTAARPATAATRTVEARNYVFDPATLTISVGDTVVWTFAGEPHTVTSGSGPSDPRLGEAFDSGLVEAGGRFEVTFSQPGTYPYICLVHIDSGMAGTIVVRAPPTPTPKPTPRRTATPTPKPTPRPSQESPTPAPTPTETPSPTPPAPTASPTPVPPSSSPPSPSPPSPSPLPSASASPASSSPLGSEPTGTTADQIPIVGLGALLVLLAVVGAAVAVGRRR